MENVSIKSFAKKAKHRLGSGFWNDIRIERANNMLNANENAQHIKELYAKRLMHALYFQNESAEDTQLYRKVCKLLSKEEFYINPIGQLIDHKTFDNLDDSSKQTYIIKLTDKYNEMRLRYERERQIHRC